MAGQFLLLAISSAALLAGPADTNRSAIHVDADATGPAHTGESWCEAFVHLQDALAVAASGTTILVADGVYTPDQGFGQTVGDRHATFQIPDGVVVIGGVAGCGAIEPDERDTFQFVTVLSGDLEGDDKVGFRNTHDNSYHVVTASYTSQTTVLEGVTILGGNAVGINEDARGGGLSIVDGVPTVRNCTFRRNQAILGGAVNCEGGGPSIEHCMFEGNKAVFSGGALRGWDARPSVLNGLFASNVADAGGAAWFGASTVSLKNATFAGNSATLGNALSFDSCCPRQPSTVTVANCVFDDGGAEIDNQDASTVIVTYTRIDGVAGEGNITDDPRFVPGPVGCYYLSDVTAGEPATSACIDAGLGSATSAGLASYTTRSDQSPDTGIVDMGYHYPITRRSLIPGDYDRSQTLDLRDAAAIQRCYTGTAIEPLDIPPCCRIFDTALDHDVDPDDVAFFSTAMTGP